MTTQQESQFFGLSDDMLEGANQNDVPFHKFKNGTHKFRLLPPFDAKTLFFEEWIHWMQTKEGHPRAIPCGRRFYNSCPLCERRILLNKHRDRAEAMGDMALKERMNLEARAWGARPVVMWNILIGDDYKILQLGSNHHVELLKKVNFWWKEKRINLTAPTQNYMMWCERTGQKAQTRYTFEVLDSIPPSNINVPPMMDLMKVYEPLKMEEMMQVAQTGFAPSYPNARQKMDPGAPLEEYTGPMIGHLNQFGGQQQPQDQGSFGHMAPPTQQFAPPPAAPAYQPPAQPQYQQPAQPAYQPPVAPPAAPQPQHPNVNPGSHFHTPPPATSQPAPQAPVNHQPPPTAPQPAAPAPTAPVNQNQETEIANMLAALQGGKQ